MIFVQNSQSELTLNSDDVRDWPLPNKIPGCATDYARSRVAAEKNLNSDSSLKFLFHLKVVPRTTRTKTASGTRSSRSASSIGARRVRTARTSVTSMSPIAPGTACPTDRAPLRRKGPGKTKGCELTRRWSERRAVVGFWSFALTTKIIIDFRLVGCFPRRKIS